MPHPLLEVLAADGKTTPFPIQVDTLPDTLAGRDVLGRGKTGSGKTLAFSIPMVARLGTRLAGGPRRPGRPLGMVLAPTRELATQINAVLEPLAKAYGLTTTTIFGGVSQNRQVAALKAGVDIIVACPGRLEDLMQQKFAFLDAVEITVLDEADHMADLGFLPGVTRILKATPENGQRLLFSATLDNGVDKLVRQFLHNPALHEVDEANSPVSAMTHHVFGTNDTETKKQLIHALASGTGRRILFMRTKHHAKKLAQQLTAAGIPAVDLHGNLSQPQRDRNLAAFSAGTRTRARRDRRRGSRRPRGRRRARRARRPAHRAQGVPAPLRSHGSRRQRGRRRHPRAPRPGEGPRAAHAQGRHPGRDPARDPELGCGHGPRGRRRRVRQAGPARPRRPRAAPAADARRAPTPSASAPPATVRASRPVPRSRVATARVARRARARAGRLGRHATAAAPRAARARCTRRRASAPTGNPRQANRRAQG